MYVVQHQLAVQGCLLSLLAKQGFLLLLLLS